jgi:hypothetical protein
MKNTARVAMTVLIALHLAVTIWHGNAHTVLAITLPPVKTAFVFIVILIAPLLGLLLLWTRFTAVGASMLVLSMLGALLFGVYHHYLMVSPDNVGHLPAGNASAQSAFVASATGLALIELASAVYGALYLRMLRRTPQRRVPLA